MLFPQGDATFSACGRYRYRLTRDLGGKTTVTFIMLNPSTADGRADDPTIRRCKGFARSLGYGQLVIVNLFAFRATDPRDMWKARELGVDIVGEPSPGYDLRIGPSVVHRPAFFPSQNDTEIYIAAGNARPDGIVICAWGKGGGKNVQHAKIVAARADYVAHVVGGDLWCLGTNESDGSPKHPLYLAEDTQPVIWRSA